MLGVGPALVALVSLLADSVAAPAGEASQCVTVPAVDDHQLAVELTAIPPEHIDDQRKVRTVRTERCTAMFLDDFGRDARRNLPSDHFPIEAGEQRPLQRSRQR
jgi:hypothetical protein